MAVYNLFLKEVTSSTLTFPATTLAVDEALGKTTVEPTAPSTTLYAEDGTQGQKAVALLNLSSGEGLSLKEALEAGAKVTAAKVWVYAYRTEGESKLIFGVVSPLTESEQALATSYAWYSVPLSSAHAKELTLAKLEALELFVESKTSAHWRAAALYLSVETEPETKGELGGTITASTSFAGEAQAKGNAKGTIAATTALSGGAKAKGHFAGTIAATTALDGDLQGAKGTLHGTLASGSNLTGDLQAPGRLEGDLPVLSGFSARLAGFGHLAGELVAQSAWSGMAQARGVLRGILDAVVELVGRLAHPEHFFPGKATITINRVNNAAIGATQVNHASVGAHVVNHAEVQVILP